MAELTDEQLHIEDDEDFEALADTLDDSVENADEVEQVTAGEPEVAEGSEESNDSEQADEESEAEEVSETKEDTLESTETEEEETEDESHNGQEPQPDEDNEPSEEADELDYEAMYKQLMGPVKVGGKEFTVKSIDDAKKLLGMGFSFSDNMRGVKPLRAVGKTLEDAGIIKDGVVDEAALTRLIDINNGDTNALAQLMKERDLDPLDMSTEDINYTPMTTMATEQSVDIQSIEKELVSRGTVDTVISELDKLDSKSKVFFNESPDNLLKLEEDITSGVYKTIMDTVKYEKSLGRLSGTSDMEAYIQLASQQEEATATTVAPNSPKPSVKKRKAAAITKRAPAKKTIHKVPDYVGMSDEDFEKLAPADTMY